MRRFHRPPIRATKTSLKSLRMLMSRIRWQPRSFAGPIRFGSDKPYAHGLQAVAILIGEELASDLFGSGNLTANFHFDCPLLHIGRRLDDSTTRRLGPNELE